MGHLSMLFCDETGIKKYTQFQADLRVTFCQSSDLLPNLILYLNINDIGLQANT